MTQRTSRRSFLRSAVGSAAVVSLSGALPGFLHAAPNRLRSKGERILVVIQLNGGNDGLNTVVPYKLADYRRARPTLALPEEQILTLEKWLGLHPRLTGFAKLWEEGKLGVLQGVGYPNPDRSHFTSMDVWNSAQRNPARQQTGWLGRWLDRTVPADSQEIGALHLGERTFPLALSGAKVHAAGVRSLEAMRLDAFRDAKMQAALDASLSAERDGGLLGFLQDSTRVAVHAGRRLSEAHAQYKPAVEYPGSQLGGQLRTVAELIDADLPTRIYYVMLDGFDTHADQAAAHAGLLGQLGDATAAFLADLDSHGHGERTAVMTFSEFGRRVKENGSRGTDHGAAAPMFVAGAGVKGGLHGAHPRLDDLDDGDLKHHTDFRQVYATLVSQWLGGDPVDALGGRFAPLPILRKPL